MDNHLETFNKFDRLIYVHMKNNVICNLTDTVNSSLFVEHQCSWILWVTLTYEFTSPRTFIDWLIVLGFTPYRQYSSHVAAAQTFNIVMNYLAVYASKVITHEITSQWPSKILSTHEHWPPRVRTIPQYINSQFFPPWNMFACLLIFVPV